MLGNAEQGLLTIADQVHADLIVMTTRGRSGLKRAVLGSVADHVVRNSVVPVLLVSPESAEAIRRARANRASAAAR